MTDLGPKPEPQIEPGEPNPGGVDAIDGGDDGEPTVPDLGPERNPAVEDKAPDEIRHETNEDDPSSDGASEPERDAPP